ncbi:MAG: squalene synthase HpnC [Chloroflexi bacterium]|nr:squalene synthase HpnC [Chloroflexota bacterium]
MGTLLAGDQARVSAAEAYELCERLAKSQYENFTVGSRLLPRDKRKHLYAIYAFCRFVDDLGDEFQGDRLEALDYWEKETEACFSGTPRHPYLIGVQETIRLFDIPREPFLRLIQANRMDQTGGRHATYEDLDFYCQHSANPVGHIVLYVSGYRDEERQRLSDYTCTALQLTNFWQDVARDFAMGRIYIPLEDMDRFGYAEADLANGRATDSFRELMAFEVKRTRDLFELGFPLVDMVDGNLKLDIALFSKGGLSVLDCIERQGYDVLSRRPMVGRAKKLRLLASTLLKLKLLGRA